MKRLKPREKEFAGILRRDDKCVLPGAKPENKDAARHPSARILLSASNSLLPFSISREARACGLHRRRRRNHILHFTFLSTRAAIVGAAKLFAHIHPSLARRQNTTILGANERKFTLACSQIKNMVGLYSQSCRVLLLSHTQSAPRTPLVNFR
jgi:hypothetical protein